VRRLSLATTLAGILGVFAAAGAQQPAQLSMIATRAEASGFTSTSTYDDVVRFMREVAAASRNVRYSTYGKTVEGRDLPLAVVGSNLSDATPAAVRASGKLRVHIQGNVHAGEVDGKESAQMLLRDLAMGRHDDWLESTISLVTPILNADGNEKMSLTSRLPQHGPINGQGTRHVPRATRPMSAGMPFGRSRAPGVLLLMPSCLPAPGQSQWSNRSRVSRFTCWRRPPMTGSRSGMFWTPS
jgi:murein tripeptide amidase MpaA